MKKNQTVKMVELLERQVRGWEISVEVKERIEQQEIVERIPEKVRPYIAVAREAGAGCSDIAKIVTETLGMELLDKELLSFMAEKYNLSEGMLEHVDEKTCVWLRDIFGNWLDDRVVPQSKYVSHLGQIVLLAACSSNVMFVGRGAHFFLPREKGLLIAIIGPREQRLERIMAKWQMSHQEATKYMDEIDAGRRDFLKRYFHYDMSDPHVYDMILNTAHFSHEDAAHVIAEQYRRRFAAMLR